MSDGNGPHQVALVVAPEFSFLGLGLAVEPLFVANWLAQAERFRWRLLSVDGLSVRASNGIGVPMNGALGERDGFDTVLVVTSFDARIPARDQRLLGWLRRMARFGAEIGAIETGSEVLAAAGLLDGHPAAVHWYNLDGFRERYPKVQASPRLYSIGQGRMTCAGATATLDLMLHWMAERIEPALVAEVAQHLLVARRRGPEQEQNALEFDAPQPAGQIVQQTLRVMGETVDAPLSCTALAARVGLSERQLQRHFQRQVGTSLARQYLLVRLARAHKLLQQTDQRVTDVAIGCGFGSLESFSRIYRREFGRSPSRDRGQSTTSSVLRSGPAAAQAAR